MFILITAKVCRDKENETFIRLESIYKLTKRHFPVHENAKHEIHFNNGDTQSISEKQYKETMSALLKEEKENG